MMRTKHLRTNPRLLKVALLFLLLPGFLWASSSRGEAKPGITSFQSGMPVIPESYIGGQQANNTTKTTPGAGANRKKVTATPTRTPVNGAGCIPLSRMETGRVTAITDGDTIQVSIKGIKYRVRYIGIDTPETSTGKMAAESTHYNTRLVLGKQVTLYRDVSETDRFGRLLRYVVADGVFVNYELVRAGYAYASTYPPDVTCADTFALAQQFARKGATGLWASRVPAVGLVNPGPVGSNTSGQCDPSYPGVCIPPSPPDLDCADITYRRFKVLEPDPHRFDVDDNGIGCERQ